MCPICLERPNRLRADCAGSHEFCSECMQQWRRQTVLKADTSTKCPMCRQPFREVIPVFL